MRLQARQSEYRCCKLRSRRPQTGKCYIGLYCIVANSLWHCSILRNSAVRLVYFMHTWYYSLSFIVSAAILPEIRSDGYGVASVVDVVESTRGARAHSSSNSKWNFDVGLHYATSITERRTIVIDIRGRKVHSEVLDDLTSNGSPYATVPLSCLSCL